MNIKPGNFIKHGGCDIFFEVESVHSTFIICASRDPKHGTDLVYPEQITSISTETPTHHIKLDRTKDFYDKFFPEGWQPHISKVIPFSEIVEGTVLITTKGLCTAVKKKGCTWILKGKQKTLTSKNHDTYHWQFIQDEKFVG